MSAAANLINPGRRGIFHRDVRPEYRTTGPVWILLATSRPMSVWIRLTWPTRSTGPPDRS